MKKTLLKKVLPVIFAALILCSFCSCGASNGKYSETADMMTGDSFQYNSNTYRDYDAGGMMPEVEMEMKEEAAAEAPTSTVNKDKTFTRKIIYSSWYNISTEEYDKAIAALDALCEQHGAYYESAESYGDQSEYSNRHSSFTIRIPVENYKSFISQAGTIGTVTSSGQSNEDVTERYYDTEARLESALLREERILEILKNADNLDDVLLLERELSDVRYEIENFQGTLKKYDSLVSYSTATVRINEVKKVVMPDSEKQSLGQRMIRSLERGFDSFCEGLGDMLVDISYSLPVIIFIWLPIIIIVVVAISVFRASRKKKNTKIITEKPTEDSEKTENK